MRHRWQRCLAAVAVAAMLPVAAAAQQDERAIAQALADRLSKDMEFEDASRAERSLALDVFAEMNRMMADAVPIEPRRLTVRRSGSRYQLVDRGVHIVWDFGPHQRAARLVWLVFRTYGIDRMCFVGRPNPSFFVPLAGGETRLNAPTAFYKVTLPGQAPTGEYPAISSSYRNLETIRFQNSRLDLREVPTAKDGRYRIVEGDMVLYSFDNRAEAVASMVYLRLYGFDRKHIVYAEPGSREEVFSYLTKSDRRH